MNRKTEISSQAKTSHFSLYVFNLVKGVYAYNDTVYPIPPNWTDDFRPIHTGHKKYELKNHLGNVMAVVHGRKQAVQGSSGVISHYTAIPAFSGDYSAFEVRLRGRGNGDYRYGFNGMERTDEISGKGNHYTAEFWEYDSRLGRRWNIDPVDQIYISNYATFMNNPIWYIDPLGNRATKYEDEEGNLLLETEDGNDDVVTVSNDRLEDFQFYSESYNDKEMKPRYDSKVWNDNMKADILDFETIGEMESFLGNTSSQRSRQKLINYKQDPSLANWAIYLGAEVVSQNINPLNHIPSPINVSSKTPKLKVVAPKPNELPNANPWILFNKESGSGKFTKENYGSSQNAAKARMEAYRQWKLENGH